MSHSKGCVRDLTVRLCFVQNCTRGIICMNIGERMSWVKCGWEVMEQVHLLVVESYGIQISCSGVGNQEAKVNSGVLGNGDLLGTLATLALCS